jgi:hypothetical protein
MKIARWMDGGGCTSVVNGDGDVAQRPGGTDTASNIWRMQQIWRMYQYLQRMEKTAVTQGAAGEPRSLERQDSSIVEDLIIKKLATEL